MIDREDGWIDEVTRSVTRSDAPERGPRAAGEGDRPRGRAPQRRLNAMRAMLRNAKEQGDTERADRLERNIRRMEAAMRDGVAEPPAPAADRDEPLRFKRQVDMPELVEEAYLRTVCRLPTDDEQRIAAEYMKDAENPIAGLRDLLWSLLNTKEFIVNR
jgi:hypothetical protein